MGGVEFAGHNKVTAAIESQPAVVHENQTNACLPCQNSTTQNPQTRERRKCTGTPPPRWVPPQPGTPPAPSEDKESSETEGVRLGNV